MALAADGGTALAATERYAPDVIVLDVAMPGLDGLAVCRRLRDKGLPTPILMLTARDAVSDRVAGLEAGADDYLVKPFAVQELIARIRALTRRHGEPQGLLSYADLVLDPAARTATRSGRAIEFTGRETALLELLLRQPGRTVTRELALEEIWDGAAETERRRPLRHAAAAQARRAAADPHGPRHRIRPAGLIRRSSAAHAPVHPTQRG